MHQNVLDDLDIRQLKLTNGEEIIAFVQGVDAEAEGLWLENPVQINYSLHSEDAKQEYYLTTWMTFADLSRAFFIESAKVITTGQVLEEVKLRYIKMVTNFDQEEADDLIDDILEGGDGTPEVDLETEDFDGTIH